jgi:hypothetical protein
MWVKRDGEGNVSKKSRLETAECTEWMDSDHPDDLSFVRGIVAATHPLTDYRDNRIIEYLSKSDQLDAITKTLKYLRDNGVDIGPDGEAYITQIDGVKNKYPKP